MVCLDVHFLHFSLSHQRKPILFLDCSTGCGMQQVPQKLLWNEWTRSGLNIQHDEKMEWKGIFVIWKRAFVENPQLTSCWTNEGFPCKMRNKTRMHILVTSVRQCAGSPSQGNQDTSFSFFQFEEDWLFFRWTTHTHTHSMQHAVLKYIYVVGRLNKAN